MPAAAPYRPSRRHTARVAVIVAGAVTAALAGTSPALGDPPTCGIIPKNLQCGGSEPGGSSDGDPGGGGIPEVPGVNAENNFNDLGPAAPSTAELAQLISSRAAFPAVKVHTAPADRTFVQVRTGLWVDGFQTVQTPAITVAGQTIQATATPRSVTWNLGETTITCDGPGSPNDTTCGHTYKRSSTRQPGGAYRISGTITWSVSWTCTGACDAPAGTLGDQPFSSPPATLVVGEIQTNTRP